MPLARYPPVVELALAAGIGAAAFHHGFHPLGVVILPAALFLPNRTSSRPLVSSAAFLAVVLAGLLLSYGSKQILARDCRFHLEEGSSLRIKGLLIGPLTGGRAELLPLGSKDSRCRKPIRIVVPEHASEPMVESEPGAAGGGLELQGTWMVSSRPAEGAPLRAGYLRVDSMAPLSTSEGLPGPIWRAPESARHRIQAELVTLGGHVQRRLNRLFPNRSALAVALVWARKDGIPSETRDAFARAGTAHLLAISGFHVGVVAGVLLLLVGWTGLSHPARYLLASVGVWAYVIAIGLPDAAFRAAILLAVLSLGRLWGRRVASLGALATAFLGFLFLDPAALPSPGFQLSFAGALGLAIGYRPTSRWIHHRSGGRLPLFLCRGLGAGVAATLATLPLVAWHFGRLSLIGIPLTLVLTPLVAVAIPGIFLSLMVSAIHLGSAGVIAAGTEVLLGAMGGLVEWAAALPFASIWVSRPVLVSGLLAWVVALLLVSAYRRTRAPHRRGWPAWQILAVTLGVGVSVGPLTGSLLARGKVEIVVLDVGQGDATLLRSPSDRWVLVDAGPRTRSFDAGERRVLPYLRQRGIELLELMILTHPDMDHVGGAASVLKGVPVRKVLDPGHPAGTQVFLDALKAADGASRPWLTARAGDSMNLDGMAIRVLAPEDSLPGVEEDGNNAASVVLEIRFGSFAAILAGDAPAQSEEVFLPRILSDGVQLLKVGHHGSSTSTSQNLLRMIEPAVALISVGKRNRFGHPHPEVVLRLQANGAEVYRTDRHGTLTVRARPDGTYSVSTQYR